MVSRRTLFLGWLLGLFVGTAGMLAPSPASAAEKVTWTARLVPSDVRAGEAAQLVVEAKIEAPWHIYSLKKPSGPGPTPTSIELVANPALKAGGAAVQPEPHRERDEGFEIDVELFEGGVAFGVPVQVTPAARGQVKALVKVRSQACNAGTCLIPRTDEVPVSFSVAAGAARPDRLKPITSVPKQPASYKAPEPGGSDALPTSVGATGTAGTPPGGASNGSFNGQINQARDRGLLHFVWFSFCMGFLALLTPCVFPMVPITVSFFAKQKEADPSAGIRGAVAYCLGIIGTFTGVGLLVSAFFGAAGINRLATDPFVNLFLAVLFIVLAISLFGGFELMLPGWMTEKAHAGTQRGGFLGPMAMGLVFTLTSFTCTVPVVGGLLALTSQGDWLWPALGMLAFSTSFALPFFLLALFPGWLSRMPRAGGWLVTVKAFMGFLELAAALKFLSNVDLVWQLGLLERPVFLAIWSTLALVAGFYLFGLLRLPHDSGGRPGPYRLVFGTLSLVGGLWCLAAIGGRSLGEMEAFLPPDPYPGRSRTQVAGQIQWLENYDEAVKLAKEQNKPLFLNFTGVTCTNCRWMEKNMFTRPEVAAEINKMIAVELFTDKQDAESARYKKLEEDMFGTVALPLYAVITPDGEKLEEFPGLTRDPKQFLGFLQTAQEKAAAKVALEP